MLNLRCESNPGWVGAAVSELDVLLSDHVHCEKKAAVTAISFINRYPDRTLLVDHMIAHAQEELEHFALVMEQIKLRGEVLRRDSADAYVNALLAHAQREEPGRLLDALVIHRAFRLRLLRRGRRGARQGALDDRRDPARHEEGFEPDQ